MFDPSINSPIINTKCIIFLLTKVWQCNFSNKDKADESGVDTVNCNPNNLDILAYNSVIDLLINFEKRKIRESFYDAL